jgi:hypothetical protein
MKKIIGAMFALAFGAVAVSTAASATPLGLTDTGIVTFTPADPTFPNIIHVGATAVGLSLDMGEPVEFIGRLADGFTFINPLDPNLAGALLGGTGLDGKSGTWQFVSAAGYVYNIVAVEIDAGGGLTNIGAAHLYLTSPVANSGNWDTDDFGGSRFHPDLNYLDFYGVYAGRANVPEPMSLLLAGGGLAGFGFLRRKKRA